MNRGKLLESAVRRIYPNLTKLAEKLPWGVRTIYRHFGDENLSYEQIAEYAKVIKYDFKEEFPELELFRNTLAEPVTVYNSMSSDELRLELENYRSKYEALLEKYNSMLENYLELKHGLNR